MEEIIPIPKSTIKNIIAQHALTKHQFRQLRSSDEIKKTWEAELRRMVIDQFLARPDLIEVIFHQDGDAIILTAQLKVISSKPDL